ncbi:MAG: aminotransferase class V-fold PLP-dependent enzyme, partial [Rickettsiales bacterium]|nr:aminotransferase class V-fold PLP-dependent enzyme [Rickettsiales bacterium]
SGATESNNLAIKGVAHFYQNKGKHIITMSVEHKCVLESCKILETEGFEVTYLDPEIDGLLDLNKLKDAIRKDTILISIMGVNNETGVIQNLEAIGKIAHEHSILFHTDCAQAFGKIQLDVERMHIDLMSISSHKIYGPKGIGGLYVRQKPKVRLVPIIHGGGQERGIRSGTLSTPLCVGFGLASQIIHSEMEQDRQHIQRLADSFLDKVLQMEDVFLNGNRQHKIPGCNNISFLHIEGESLMLAIQNMCISTGSACNSANLQPSYVISKMRRDEYYAHSAMRFGFGRFTKQKEVNTLTSNLIKAVNHLRSISPLWEMKKQGIDFNQVSWD